MTNLTEKQLNAIENAIGGTDDPAPGYNDNLAIMLCSYFSRHMDRPEDDVENEDNYHWGTWVLDREKAMRREIALTAIKAYEKAMAR